MVSSCGLHIGRLVRGTALAGSGLAGSGLGVLAYAAVLVTLASHQVSAQATAATSNPSAVAQAMGQAAQAWLDALAQPIRSQATFAMEGKERLDWAFIPKHRLGVSLRDMNLDQRRAAHALLRSALSDQGYLKATTVMALEETLRTLEADRPDVEEFRHPGKYWFAVFGDPGGAGPWGWRVEGHHLSLHFSVVPGEGVAVAPAFFGANPAEVPRGLQAGLRVLGREEDLARGLLGTLDANQRRAAVIADQAPRDIVTAPGVALDQAGPQGLAYRDMTLPQRAALQELVRQMAHNLCRELAERSLQEIEGAGWDDVRFAWAGSDQPRQGHYFRLHGPTFLVEYDNTQNDANHIHLVWHAANNDFGADMLRRHYADHPHAPVQPPQEGSR